MSIRAERPPSKVASVDVRRQAAGWARYAEALADWANSHLVMRRDAWGAYTPKGGQFTARGVLDRELLVRHFRGEITIGVHPISTDNQCKWVSLDIDAHDDKPAEDLKAANWSCAVAAVGIFANLGLDALVFDSNGKGGYHVRVFFKKPIPSEAAYWLVGRVKEALEADGHVVAEAFPKQGSVSIGRPYGNWLRLPGRHHKRDHWGGLCDPETGKVYTGEAVARRLLKIAGDDPARSLDAYREEMAARPEAKRPPREPRDFGDTDEDELRSALDALPDDWANSYGGSRSDTGWLGVGMALHSWNTSRGLALWDEFSRRSGKYEPGACEAKWATFSESGGLTVASIFKEAYDRGWQSPRRNGKPPRNGSGGPPTVVPRITPGDDPEDDGPEPEVIDLWPKIDPRAFHGIAGEIVDLADPHNEGDPTGTLVQLLVGIGNLIGRGPYFSVAATRHYLNLFAAMVGATAVGRKGTSWGVVEWVLGRVDLEWTERNTAEGLISGEGLMYHVRDEIKKGNDVVDPGIADKRMLVIESEFGRTLQSMNRDGNTLSGVMRQAWDKGKLQSLAKNSPIKATNAHISIIAHVTKADIQRHLTETDNANGFANRFLWCGVRRSKFLPEGGDLESLDWNPLVKRLAAGVHFARGVSRMERSPSAKELWAVAYEQLEAPRPGVLGNVLTRGAAQTMRLACLFALLDQSRFVAPEHLIPAIAIWEYCEASARFIFGNALGDSAAEKVLAALRAAPDGLTRKDITVTVFQRHKKSEEIARVLSDLLTGRLIHRTTVRSGQGRPAERWHAGPGAN